jgi:hypothetical protein
MAIKPRLLPTIPNFITTWHSELINYIGLWPIPVAARSKVWVCGRSLVGSNPAGSMDVLSLVSVVCCQAEVSASGCSLVQRSPTECSVSEWDREAQ